MTRLAIVTSHPIQYNAPWFKLLSQSPGVQLKVFYTWEQSMQGDLFDPGFGKKIAWDIPLLNGYEYSFVKNTATDPGTHRFKGIVTPTLCREIEEWKANLLLVIGWSFDSHLSCMRHFHGKVPVIFRGDSTLLDENSGIKRITRRIFLRWVYSHVDYALYTGTHNKNYFLKHGLKERQLVFGPHAVDNERFRGEGNELDTAAAAWRQTLGLGEQDFVVLFAAKLEPKKAPDFMIRLAKRLKDNSVRFFLVGNGPLEQELKEMAVNDKRIQFLDFQNQTQMPLVYRLGDVFILPSTGPGETWGLAVNEAMACSKPVMVSSKAGCAIDLIENDKNGIIFNCYDVDSCVGFIRKLLHDSSLKRKMGVNSQELINNYSFHQLVQNITGLLSKL